MKVINEHQKQLYERYDFKGSERYLARYIKYLDAFKNKECIKILDIGGASGYFAYLLKEYFCECTQTEVYVVDTTAYNTWDENALGRDVHFIHDSVENLTKLFPEDTFDVVFANRVFHHFIDRSYKTTLEGMEKYLSMIRAVLKADGLLCVMDHFYDGMIIDSAASRMIYMYTSFKNPIIATLIKRLGAMTAGVGVCFQSEKMWLNRVRKCGFQIAHVERTDKDPLRLMKKIGLLCRRMSRNNLIIASPKK